MASTSAPATPCGATNRYHLAVADTEQLYASDAYRRSFDAVVSEITPE
jgi:hypothetical protein